MQEHRLIRVLQDLCFRQGPLNLITLHGPLDLLATIGRGMDFAELPPHTRGMELGEEVRVRVLHLETIISVKEQLGTEKDLAVLPILRRTLSEFKKYGE